MNFERLIEIRKEADDIRCEIRLLERLLGYELGAIFGRRSRTILNELRSDLDAAERIIRYAEKRISCQFRSRRSWLD